MKTSEKGGDQAPFSMRIYFFFSKDFNKEEILNGGCAIWETTFCCGVVILYGCGGIGKNWKIIIFTEKLFFKAWHSKHYYFLKDIWWWFLRTAKNTWNLGKMTKFTLKFEYCICSHSSKKRSHGVMVSTLDFESSDPSSNLGGTSQFYFFRILSTLVLFYKN